MSFEVIFNELYEFIKTSDLWRFFLLHGDVLLYDIFYYMFYFTIRVKVVVDSKVVGRSQFTLRLYINVK